MRGETWFSYHVLMVSLCRSQRSKSWLSVGTVPLVMVVNKPIKELAYWQQYAAWRWRAVAKVRVKNSSLEYVGEKR